METITSNILRAKRKRLFGSKPIFVRYRDISETDLLEIERKIHTRLSADLRSWLLLAGYGDIDESLSFRAEWIKLIEFGALKGNVLFAQDILGNFYSFDPKNGQIYFFSRSVPEYALISVDFRSFMDELVHRDFHIIEWVDTLSGAPYDWHA